MGVVNGALEFGCDLAQFDHFLGGSVGTRYIEKARRKAECPLFHSFADQGSHLIELIVRRLAIFFPKNHFANIAVPDEVVPVGAYSVLTPTVKARRYVAATAAVHPEHECRNPLRKIRERVATVVFVQFCVTVRIDKSRRYP